MEAKKDYCLIKVLIGNFDFRFKCSTQTLFFFNVSWLYGGGISKSEIGQNPGTQVRSILDPVINL